jgi:hypothetical protein
MSRPAVHDPNVTVPRKLPLAHINCAASHKKSILPSRFCALGSDAGSMTQEGRPLDLVQRINVLAICAAFVFVGAILLGMF